MICALALLASAILCGSWAGLTSGVLLTVGGFVADSRFGAPAPERLVRAALFFSLVLGVAWSVRWLRTQRERSARLAGERADREALLQASLEIVADALVVTDEAGVIQSFSQAAERLFGWTAAEVVGQNFRRLMPAGEDGALDETPAAGEGGISQRQVMGRRKDGETFPMDLRIAEACTGARRYRTMVVRDLTSIQEAERRAQELSAQLTQVWSLNSMGEMASVLAHELNQPLSAVANYLRAARNLIARMELDDDDLIDAVARAGDQAVRAGEIIRTMRDLAQRGGTLQKPESLAAVIGEVDFIVSLMARDAGVRIFYDLYKGDDVVIADRIQIQQLVVNLARNAIEAVTKYPNRQINISTRPDADGGMVTTVEDSGPGIDESVAGRLFQPLASTKPEGMGLGLSISSAIVENHRGRIWVEPSRLGGAAFCFVLARAGSNGGGSDRSDGVRRR
jgi:two-component system sensor kinase FixL